MPSDGLRSLVPFTFHTFTFRLLPPPLLAWQLVPTCHIRKEEGGRLTKPHMHYELHFSAAAQILKSQWERHIYTRTNKKQVQVQVNTDVAKKWKKKNKKQIRKMTLIPNKTADIQMTEKCCWNWSVAVKFSFVNQNRKKIYNVRKNLTLAPGKAAKSFCIKLVLWWIFPAGTNYSHLIHYGLLEFFLGKSCADGGIWFVKGKIT